MSRINPHENVCPRRFPRVSGDEPPTNTIGTTNAKFSPRERG